MRFYVSSTSDDLGNFRSKVAEVIQRSGHQALHRGLHRADANPPLDECLKDVSKCDVYIGVFAWRYGHVAHGKDASTTELEYRHAKANGLPTLIFVLDAEASWPPELIDKGAAGERMNALRNELMKQTDNSVALFTNREDLLAKAAQSISQTIRRTEPLEIDRPATSTPHDVFISYAAGDKLAANATCAILERHGVRCWIAPRDVRPGDSWAGSIVDAISGCRAMVLIFSSRTNVSGHVMREVERAVSKGLTIFPVRLESVLPTRELELFISASHWLDAVTPPLERHLESLATSVASLVGASPLARSRLSEPTVRLGHVEADPPPTHARRWVTASLVALLAAASILWIGQIVRRSGADPESTAALSNERDAPVNSGTPSQASPSVPATSLAATSPTTGTPAAKADSPTPSTVVAGTPTLVPGARVSPDERGSSTSWVSIPVGRFEMGCVPDDADCAFDEKPRHSLSVAPFQMMATNVTVAEFRRFADRTGYRSTAERSTRSHGFFESEPGAPLPSSIGSLPTYPAKGLNWRNHQFLQQDSHPVVHVSWDDAVAFCSAIDARLPTEAEWEYAARAGVDGAIYPWGNRPTPVANERKMANVPDESTRRRYNVGIIDLRIMSGYDDTFPDTSPVKAFPANQLGLYDMGGNVRQWTSSIYRPYPHRADGREDRNGKGNRVLRGSNWVFCCLTGSSSLLQISKRSHEPQEQTDSFTGFRCARSVV